jgi:hypothetical protein
VEHRHLVLAYCVTWAIQLGYAAWVLRRARALGQAEKALEYQAIRHDL